MSNCGLAGIYFLVRAIFVASKLWIWQQFNFLAGRHLNYIFIDSLYHWLALMDYNPRISETRNSVNRFPIPSRAPVIPTQRFLGLKNILALPSLTLLDYLSPSLFNQELNIMEK